MTRILFDALGNPKPISEDVNADLAADIAALKKRLTMHKQAIEELVTTNRQLHVTHEQVVAELDVKIQQKRNTITKQEKQLIAAEKRFTQAKTKITSLNKVNKERLAQIKALEHQLDYEYLKKKRNEVQS